MHGGAFKAIVLAGTLISTPALARVNEERSQTGREKSTYLAPLIYEAVGTSGRACGYQARYDQMNLTVDRALQCPAAVVCERRRTSIKPICRSPIAPWKLP